MDYNTDNEKLSREAESPSQRKALTAPFRQGGQGGGKRAAEGEQSFETSRASRASNGPYDMRERPAYWAVLPAAIRYDPEIPAAAKLLYAEISALTEAKGYCYASNDYFLRLYGMAERTLQRHLKALETAGYIRILDGNGGQARRKIYAGVNPLGSATTPHPLRWSSPGQGSQEGCEGAEERNPDKNDGVTPTKMTGAPDKNVTQNKKENKKENDPPKAPQGAGADFEPKKAPDWKPERWEKFWKFYPLHKSEQAAIKAWDRLKPSDELLAVIGHALVRQIAEKQAECDRRRIPFEWKIHASTYLNGARWTDEEDETPEMATPHPLRGSSPGQGSLDREEDGEWL